MLPRTIIVLAAAVLCGCGASAGAGAESRTAPRAPSDVPRGLFVVGANGGPARALAGERAGRTGWNSPVWSADGTAVVAVSTRTETSSVVRYPLDGPPQVLLAGVNCLPSFSGIDVLGAGGTLFAGAPGPFDGRVDILDTTTRQRRARVPLGEAPPQVSAAFSPDGRLVAVAWSDLDGKRGIEVADLGTGKVIRRWRTLRDPELSPQAFSSDGSRLAYATYRDRIELFVADVRTGARRHLTAVADEPPAWSPRGGELATAARGRLLLVRVRGGGTRALTARGRRLGDPRWSPDGRRLAAVAGRRGIAVVDPGAGTVRTVARGSAGPPAWSPDGGRLAFVRFG